MKNLIIATVFIAFGVFALWDNIPAFLDATTLMVMYIVKQTTVLLPYLLVAGAVLGVAKLTNKI